VLDNLDNSLLLLGRTGEAEETVRQAVALSRDSGNAHHLGMTLATLAKVLLARGEDAAAGAAAEALALADKLGDVLNQSEAGSVVAQVRLAHGDTARALAGFAQAVGQAQRINQPQPEIVALLGLAATHLRLGDPEAAIGLAQRALARAHEGGYRIRRATRSPHSRRVTPRRAGPTGRGRTPSRHSRYSGRPGTGPGSSGRHGCSTASPGNADLRSRVLPACCSDGRL
jgi:tetratricopeptide (TPR) repeat protein